MNKRIGVFSGTFDPVHIGHVEAALVAKAAKELEQVLIFVEKKPRRKAVTTSYKDRIAMLKLALSDFPSFVAVDPIDQNVSVAGTLDYLKKHYPTHQPVLIIGSDMLEHLESWEDASLLFEKMNICVVLRSLAEQRSVEEAVAKIQNKYTETEVTILPPVWSPVSSSKVKQDLHRTGTCDLIHRDVLHYIKDKKLY